MIKKSELEKFYFELDVIDKMFNDQWDDIVPQEQSKPRPIPCGFSFNNHSPDPPAPDEQTAKAVKKAKKVAAIPADSEQEAKQLQPLIPPIWKTSTDDLPTPTEVVPGAVN